MLRLLGLFPLDENTDGSGSPLLLLLHLLITVRFYSVGTFQSVTGDRDKMNGVTNDFYEIGGGSPG